MDGEQDKGRQAGVLQSCTTLILGWGDRSHLSILLHDGVKDALVCGVGKATFFPRFLIVLISCAEPLWAKVEGIAEWFVDTSQAVAASHKDLGGVISDCGVLQQVENW